MLAGCFITPVSDEAMERLCRLALRPDDASAFIMVCRGMASTERAPFWWLFKGNRLREKADVSDDKVLPPPGDVALSIAVVGGVSSAWCVLGEWR